MKTSHKVIMATIIILLIPLFTITLIYEMYKLNKNELQNGDNINEVIVNKTSGSLGNYEYEINNDCSNYNEQYNVNEKGYIIRTLNNPDILYSFIISPGTSDKISISKIKIENRILYLTIEEESVDSSLGNKDIKPVCITLSKKKTSLDFIDFEIKNSNGYTYSEINQNGSENSNEIEEQENNSEFEESSIESEVSINE